MLLFVACKLKLGLRLVIGKCFIFAKLCCLNYPFAACFLIFFKQNLLSISCRLQPIRIWIVKLKGNLAYQPQLGHLLVDSTLHGFGILGLKHFVFYQFCCYLLMLSVNRYYPKVPIQKSTYQKNPQINSFCKQCSFQCGGHQSGKQILLS